ncbi:MAG: UTP--glucose-1-phosphate uridylyltransferase GalU [Leptospirales bacterium]
MKEKVRKAIFPLAGHGTRFLPMTKASPKEMLPLVDKPVVQYVVEEAVASGIGEIIMITGRGKRAIEDHFDISYELEDVLMKKGKLALLEEVRKISDLAEIVYTRQKESKGLGHAVLCGRQLIGSEPFAVALGDEVIDGPEPALSQLISVFHRVNGPVIGVQRVPKADVPFYGIAAGQQLEEGLIRIDSLVEKPSVEDAPSDLAVIGRYVLTADIFEILETQQPGVGGEIQLTDALRTLSGKRPIYAYEVKGHRYDTGDKLGFLKATVQFGLKNPDLGGAFREYLERILSLSDGSEAR